MKRKSRRHAPGLHGLDDARTLRSRYGVVVAGAEAGAVVVVSVLTSSFKTPV